MTDIKVAQINDLADGQKMKITCEGKEILLTNIHNSYYAVDNTCPHMGGSLFDGKLEGSHIICPRHGSVFDITTGQVVKSGKLLFVKVKVHDLKLYPVKIIDHDILIGME